MTGNRYMETITECTTTNSIVTLESDT